MSGYGNSASPTDVAASDQEVVGNVASAATDSGNPVKVGGVNRTTLPTLTDGQRGDLQMGTRGSVHTTLFAANSTAALQTASPADAQAISTMLMAWAMNGVYNGSTWDRARGNTTGTIVIPPRGWVYAAATGGIDNSSTAVTLAAAAGSSVRNYLQSMQIDHDTLGAATEIAVRDGAGGTVLWRGKLQTTAVEGAKIVFDPPLASTANTLLEFVTLTAVTGDVLVNAQGYTAP